MKKTIGLEKKSRFQLLGKQKNNRALTFFRFQF